MSFPQVKWPKITLFTYFKNIPVNTLFWVQNFEHVLKTSFVSFAVFL